MSNSASGDRPGDEPGDQSSVSDPHAPSAPHDPTDAPKSVTLGGGIGKAVRAGIDGESISGRGVLEAIGGWRGIAETLVPGILFLAMFTVTQDARISAIPPAVLALGSIVVRLVRREPAVSAFSGAAGVAIAVAATLFTGRGEDYYLPGFWTNGAWSIGLLISLLVGWPLLGFILGGLRGDLRSWRKNHAERRAATGLTLMWLGLFLARLAVQLPLYFAGHVEALGIARLVMGIPLFALVVVFTWMVFSRLPQTSDDSIEVPTDDTGQNTQSE